MKLLPVTIFLMLCVSCAKKEEATNKTQAKTSNQNIHQPAFQSIIDAAEVNGAILIYDLKEDRYYSNDFEWSKKGNLPASTFKIANSIIGLETGVIESDSTIFKWDGKKKSVKNWEQDLALKDAFQFSCVPCYQEVARKIGVKRMKEYIKKISYGNLKIDSTNIDNFWLEGASRISQMQQIDFLKRFYQSKLPISKRTEKILSNIMLIETTDVYKLNGKSGLSNVNEKYNGWYVGFIELQTNTYFFATNLEPKNEFEFNSFIKKRLDVTLEAFKEMNVLH